MKSTILSFLFKSVFLTLFIAFVSVSSAQICVDGDYCPNPDYTPGGTNCAGESVDEWALASSSGQLPTSSSSTCHVNEIFGYADDTNLYLGMEVGNQGTAFFYVYFDTDCDTTNNDQCHNGADFRVKFRIKNNNVIEEFAVQEYTGPDPSTNSTTVFCMDDRSTGSGIGGQYSNTSNPAFFAEKGNINGCSQLENAWVEISFAIVTLFDPCDPTNSCPGLGITAITSQEGGSENSNDCETFPVSVPITVNNPPTAVVDPIPPCLYSDADVCFNGSNSSDPDNNIRDYEWDFDYDGTTFDVDATGVMVCHTYAPGSYTAALRVVDSFNCADTAVTGIVDFIVVDGNDKVNAMCVDDTVTCLGDINGEVSVIASGGTPGYTYLWSSGGTTAIETGLAVGSYTVTVTDINGCSDVCTASVSSPSALTTICSTNHLNNQLDCFGDMDGMVSVTAAGGTPAFTYLWNNGATTTSISGLGIGLYTVTVTDSKGCTATCSETITQPPMLTATCSTNHTNNELDCFGDMDGMVTATAGGGTATYTYLWSNGATTMSISGLGIGTYGVTITDSKGCTAMCSEIITQPPLLTTTCMTNHTNNELDCFGDMDGMVTVSASGGTATYTYIWSTGATSTSINGLGVGDYSVTVTDSKGCTATCSETITEPPLVTATCATNHVNNILDCFGDMDGMVSVTGGGGTPGYTFLWSNGATTTSISGLGIGAYSVTVTDSKGCTATCSETITEPPLVTATCATNHVNNILDCFGDMDGMVSVTGGGGTPGYTYLWSNGATTTSISGLGIGAYSVTVTDSKGCTATCSETITEPPLVTATCATNHVNNILDCFGDMDGMVSVTGGGGTPGYTYLWSNGATTTSISGLGIGAYSVTVTDSKGCTATCSETITEPPLVTATCATNHVNNILDCFGDMDGMVSVTGGGGTPGYTYLWSNGATTASISGLGIGAYSVTVTDSKGCTATCSETITEPPLVTATCATNHVNNILDCFGDMDGMVSVTGGGGTPGYTYLWSNGATTTSISGLGIGAYSVTVTDSKGCTATCSETITEPPLVTAACATNHVNNILDCFGDMDGMVSVTGGGGTPGYTYLWSNGATTTSISGLGIGAYSVTVTDSKGCTATCSETITEPPLVTATCATNHVNNILDCFGDMDGMVSVTGGGGTPGYTYLWSNGATTTSISGLGIGAYSVTVTDSKGCTATCSETITEPPLVTATCATNHVNNILDCFGDMDGMVSVTGGGGTPGYTYLWSNGATTTSISGLGIGAYSVTVTDSKGCTATCSETITEPPLVTATCATNHVNNILDCFGDMDGMVSVTGGGGTPGYTYLWSNGATTTSISGLGIGAYSVTVTDSKGCTATCSETITEPPLVTTTCATNHVNNILDCFGDMDGMVSVTGGGGTPGYTYLWSNGATTTSISGLGIGAYSVTVTDSKGCTATCSETITEPPLVTATCATNHVNNILDCFGDMDGMVSVTGGGGTPGYTYLWSNGATTTSISGLGIGAYSVTVTDSKGCTATCSETITEPPLVTAACATNHVNNILDCFGDMDGMVSVTGGGGTPGYTYLWSNGATTSSISGLGIGTYNVTVTDSKGCTASCTETITQPTAMSCSITGGNASCGSSGGGSADAEVVGGSVPYSYLWSNGETTEDLINLNMGSYTLTVTDAMDCTSTCAVQIDGMTCAVNQTPCDINGLRGATSSVIGGSMPFSYMWSTGETTSSISGLIPGRYSVLVTDIAECETECEVVIDRCNVCDAICSTSFARLNGFETCFDQSEFDQWGWTNGLLPEGSYTLDLYAEALLCDINVGELVGQVAVIYDGDNVEVTYTTFGNYFMTLTSLYVGCDVIPIVNGVEFVSPSQYPYQQVQNNVTTYSTTIDVSTLPCEGIYLIAHAEVCAPDPMFCEITGTAVDCNGGTNGMADASVIGGTAPYLYLWSTGATTEDISGLSEGIYELTITDANNCTSSCEVRIGHAMIPLSEIGPYCRNDAPVDLSGIITDPGSMGIWFGDGVEDEIFYPSNLAVGIHHIYYDDEITCQSAALTIQITERCCPLDYAQANSRMLIGNQTVTVHYETDGILESVQKVEANTVYDSKLEITLYGEFEVELGTEFEALIDGCP